MSIAPQREYTATESVPQSSAFSELPQENADPPTVVGQQPARGPEQSDAHDKPEQSQAVADSPAAGGGSEAAREPGPSGRHLPVLLARKGKADAVPVIPRSDPFLTVSSGWRRLLRLGPSARDLDDASRRRILASPFAKPITIAAIHPKGGVGKTPTSRGLAAAISIVRGGEVVVWDNNELRGTLQLRSVATHRGHVGDLLQSADWFWRPEANILELQRVLNHQPFSHEWVLASDPDATRPITAAEFEKIHYILMRFFPITVVDNSTTELAENWRAAVDGADILIVPMKWKNDNFEPAKRMIQALNARGVQTEGRTVIVGTNGPGEAIPEVRAAALDDFAKYPVVEVPTDPALNKDIIRWDQLHPVTQRAYEQLAATAITLLKGNEK